MLHRQIRTAALGILLLAPGLLGQDSKPSSRPRAATDTQAKALAAVVSGWEKREYNAGREGLLTLTCKIEVESRGGMPGKWKASGTYTFGKDKTAPDGVLTWEDDEIATAMQRRGFTARSFAAQISPTAFRRATAGSAVHRRANGILLLTPKERAYVFDKAGVCVGEVAGPLRKRRFYRPVGDTLLCTGESYKMVKTGPKEMEIHGELDLVHAKVKGIYLPSKMTEVVKIGKRLQSDLVFTFTDHVVTLAPPKSAPSKSGTPKSRPSSKPSPKRSR